MANAKISQLPSASTPLAGTEVLPIVQSGVTEQVSVANLTFGRAVDTGNLTVTGTAGVTGDFAVATTKFIVVASTGNTSVAGTFNSAGNFSVATNKFNVTATSGDTTVAGTLGVTGATTLSDTLAVTGLTTLTGGVTGGIQALSGPGAVNVTTLTTNFTSTATGNALTLANGTSGQIKTIIYVAEAAAGDTGILTPANRLGYSSITLTSIGDTATLQYTGAAWAILAVRGATINP
jgi:hypothetical protein